jgi:hypothetical protein
MTWYEEPLDIQDTPKDVSIMIVGTLLEGLARINVEVYNGDNKVSVTEWSKVVRMTGEHITNDEVREKFWDKILKVRARHEGMAYQDWRDYISLKIGQL